MPREAENGIIGQWQEAPKEKIIEQLIEVAGDESRIIAEDLGIIPQEVIDLRLKFNLKGMAVLQFGFDEDYTTSPHHPNNISAMQITYTGTHDNDTTLGWWNSAKESTRLRVLELIGDSNDIVGSMIDLASKGNGELCIIPLQDILRLDSAARMNIPGVEQGNWRWRFSWPELN